MNRKKSLASAHIAYFGTPQFAVHVLHELEEANITPALIVSQPDKPKGRGLVVTAPPVKEWALEREIPVIQPKKLTRNDADSDILWNSDWDLFIVAAYGKIIPHDVLSLSRNGSLNVHPSLLPKYRGPSPIESQILANDMETGVSIIVLDEEVDHGAIVAQASITSEEWPLPAIVLEEMLAREGGKLLAEIIPSYIGGEIFPEPQDETKATFTKKIEKEDGLIDLSGEAYQNYLKFCAYEGWPGTYFFIERNGKKIRVKITDAEYKGGAFTPLKIIPEGKKEMSYADFMRN